MEIFNVTDYNGRQVICSEERWNVHIAAGHKIMQNNIAAVKDTITEPDSVYESNQTPKREVYFKKSLKPTYKDKFSTKVIVEYENEVGEVVTAFPQPTESGGIGNVLYKKC